MTLGEIFTNQELYKQYDKNYFHNMKMAQLLKEKYNSELNTILNTKTIRVLYKDYLNSQKFKDKIDEIKQEYKADSDYVKKYISNSKNYLNCFKKRIQWIMNGDYLFDIYYFFWILLYIIILLKLLVVDY